jgi:Zn-finger nucleic acid-binding protein
MVEALVFQCPVCGAFARAGERSCRHCSTQLATLRCQHCFDLSYPGDLHCRGCGRELGLLPHDEASDALCPDCQKPLRSFKASIGLLQACEGCGAQMVSNDLLRALVEEREALGRAVATLAEAPRGNPLDSAVRYRGCPICRDMMNRKNFGGTSGIIVDVCAKHGTFFDAGELPRVLVFVRRGGLAKARATLNQAGRAPSASGAGAALTDAHGAGTGNSLAVDLLELLDFVVDVLRHH